MVLKYDMTISSSEAQKKVPAEKQRFVSRSHYV